MCHTIPPDVAVYIYQDYSQRVDGQRSGLGSLEIINIKEFEKLLKDVVPDATKRWDTFKKQLNVYNYNRKGKFIFNLDFF